MRAFFKKITAAILAASITISGIPAEAMDSGSTRETESGAVELKDAYISLTVSGENGGFLVNTLKGNKLKKADDNKFLLYPAEDYDTSYTSFRITRKDGSEEDYIFGRDYGFLGVDSSDVAVKRQGNAVTAKWSVKDLTIEQTLSLLDESASQHGMVSIYYKVTSDRDDIGNVKARIMLDTALGYQDYGVYEMPDISGEYAHIRQERLLDNQDGRAFQNGFFVVDDPNAPKVTAYTVNTSVGGQQMEPYQVGLGHWNNLASTVFDFTPDESLNFTNPYNENYMTADSACALYYDLGAPRDGAVEMGTFYGVFSNATVGEEETAAINFVSLPASMTLDEDKKSYLPQIKDGRAGDVSVELAIENLASQAAGDMTVVINTQNEIRAYKSWYDRELFAEEETFSTVVKDFRPGEEQKVRAYFQVNPLPASEYRRFEVLCYRAGRGEELTDEKLLGSREFYLFCPGALGEVATFHSIEPQMIYTEGSRNLYLSGQNFALLKDTTAYTTYLHPLAGGEDILVPATKVVVDAEKNTMYLVIDSSIKPGGYQVVFDWNEAGREDTTSPMLQFLASDKPEYASPVYGIVTIEKAPGFSKGDPAYRLMAYADEAEYSRKVEEPDDNVYLEFRGGFSLWHDEQGNVTEAKAVSLETVDGKVSSTINISNCLDVERGSVSIVVENPGTDEQVINTNIDGKVYTTNSRTKVWSGVCAISSFENGEESTLLQYEVDGEPSDEIENSVANTNAITLMWPGAASTAQTIAGVLLEFRYCQFGMMEINRETGEKRRVIAFGAEMSPSFLVPSNFKWGERETSTMEVVQLKMAKSNYTADQLRSVQERYANDQAAWEEAEGGTLALYVHDILFGGGFVGFNTSLEVGIPSYSDGLPGVEGTLNLKIMPMDKKWEVGVEGEADFGVMQMEASLRLKSYKGIPVPDNLYFYIGGFTPGINVDGMGIFWIQGLGGGIDKLYNTIFTSSSVPPLTLMLSGQFALFAMLQARADLSLSLRGYEVRLRNVGFKGVDLIESMGVSTYWYPKLKFNASMSVDILSIIEGGGYLVLEENEEEGNIFWEGFVTASVKTPRIPLIGSITIGSADLGVNASKIWGALHVLMMDMGVTYYWGGDVDFAFGKYDAPEPTFPVAAFSGVPVYTDEETGRVLYMNLGSNAALVAESDGERQDNAQTADSERQDTSQASPRKAKKAAKKRAASRSARSGAGIESSMDRTKHTVSLGNWTGISDMALTVSFDARSEAEAVRIARGSGTGMQLVAEDGAVYTLKWLDNEKPAENQPDANALLFYDKDAKKGNVTISFTKAESFNHTWTLSSQQPCDTALYEMKHMPGLENASYTYNESNREVSMQWQGSQLENIDTLAIYAVSEEEELYTLYQTEDIRVISGGQADAVSGGVTFKLPDDLPSGSYTVQAVASSEAQSVNDIAEAPGKLAFTNPEQPQAPVIGSVRLGGDYSLDVDLTGQKDYDGYITTVYEQKGTDGQQEWEPTDFAQQWIYPEEDGSLPDMLTVGGSYTRTVMTDSEGNVVSGAEAEGRTDLSAEEQTLGLEAGKTYCVGVTGYKILGGGKTILRSAETRSAAVQMRAPSPAELTVKAADAKELKDDSDTEVTLDTVNKSTVAVQITSDQSVSGTYSLDGGGAEGVWEAANQGTVILTGAQGEEGLAEGIHTLTLRGENAAGDGVYEQYRFRVDTTGPRLQLSEPFDGMFFGEQMDVSGISEPDAEITVLLDGAEVQTAEPDADGSFAVAVPMDMTKLEQELTVYAADPAGNESRRYSVKLTNRLLGETNMHFAIYMNGEDWTNRTLPAGRGGMLELRAVSGGQSVVIPPESNVGRQAEWSVTAEEGKASLEGLRLSTDKEVNGIVLVTLDKQQAGIVLGGSETRKLGAYTVMLPQNTVGYTVSARQPLKVPEDSDFTFKVTISQGYTATSKFAVKANGVALPTDGGGNYTIRKIRSDVTVTVEGVERAAITVPAVNTPVSGDLNGKIRALWKGRSLYITWARVKGADGYDIYAQDCGKKLGKKSLVKTVKGGNKTSVKLTKLNKRKIASGKNVKVKVKAYRLVNGKKKYVKDSLTLHIAGKKSKKYTNVKKVKTSKAAYTLTVGKTAQIKAKAVKQNKKKKLLSGKHGKRFRYWSTNKKVATVSRKGKIRAVKKGTCSIYVMALDGTKRKVKVRVR